MSNSKKKQNIILAIAATLFVVGTYWWMQPDGNWQGVKVISGNTESVKLPDGSMAFLKGPSTLGYPKSFTEEYRRVKMEGEVYFEIVQNEKPFLVQSEKGGAETNGAKFIINTNGEENITVHCISDSLRMIARGKTKIFDINLEANEFCEFWRSDKRIEKQIFDSVDVQCFKK